MKCPNCNAEVYGNICEYCGSDLSDLREGTTQNITIINNYNSTNVTDNSFHGARPYIQPQEYISPKSKGVALLLCCLGFFGLAGFHRFYVGKSVSGFFHFCTWGFMWIGTIADLISLSKGTFTDIKGLPLK